MSRGRVLWGVVLLLALVLQGACGGSGTTGTAGPGAGTPTPPGGLGLVPPPPPPAPRVGTATSAEAASDEGTSLEIRAGWNMISLPVAQVSAVAPGEGVSGTVFAYDPAAGDYVSAPLTAEGLNGLGPGRGFWLFADQPGALAWTGTGTVDRLRLLPGWNLVGLPATLGVGDLRTESDQPLHQQVCAQVPAPEGCAAHSNAFRYAAAAGQYERVDLAQAWTRPASGQAAWIYAHADSTFLAPAPLPPPGPGPGYKDFFHYANGTGITGFELDSATRRLRFVGSRTPEGNVTTSNGLAGSVDGSRLILNAGRRQYPATVGEDGVVYFQGPFTESQPPDDTRVEATGDFMAVLTSRTLSMLRLGSDGLAATDVTATLPGSGQVMALTRVGSQQFALVSLNPYTTGGQGNLVAVPLTGGPAPGFGTPGPVAWVDSPSENKLVWTVATWEQADRTVVYAGTNYVPSIQAFELSASGVLTPLGPKATVLREVGYVQALAVAPARNGTPALFVGGGGRVGFANFCQWRLQATGALDVQTDERQFEGTVESLAMAPSGHHLVIGTWGPKPVRVVDVEGLNFAIFAEVAAPVPHELAVSRRTLDPPPPAEPPTIERVSLGAGGEQGESSSTTGGATADGRYVVFASAAANLVPGDSNLATDIFLRDRRYGTTVRLSTGPGGVQANGPSSAPRISSDGRYVAFQSAATNLIPRERNLHQDVFLADLQTGSLVRVSNGLAGAAPNGPSTGAALSEAGLLAFQSDASNLVEGDTNGVTDVFVYDLPTGALRRVSLAPDGAQASGPSRAPALEASGRFVAFESAAPDLVPGDTNERTDVFRRDLASGATLRVSRTTTQEQAGDESTGPAMASDGSVLFTSLAALDPADTNGSLDVYLYRAPGTVELISRSETGEILSGDSLALSMSDSGHRLLFTSDAPSVVLLDSDWPDLYVYERTTGWLSKVSVSQRGIGGTAASSTGSLTAGGDRVVFASLARDLVPDDTNNRQDVFFAETRLPTAMP